MKILRNTNGQDTIIEFDIRSKDIVDSELYYIQPGDVILVNRPKASFFKITSFSTFLSVVISSISFILGHQLHQQLNETAVRPRLADKEKI